LGGVLIDSDRGTVDIGWKEWRTREFPLLEIEKNKRKRK